MLTFWVRSEERKMQHANLCRTKTIANLGDFKSLVNYVKKNGSNDVLVVILGGIVQIQWLCKCIVYEVESMHLVYNATENTALEMGGFLTTTSKLVYLAL